MLKWTSQSPDLKNNKTISNPIHLKRQDLICLKKGQICFCYFLYLGFKFVVVMNKCDKAEAM